MSRTADKRVFDILSAIEKCQRYVDNVDSESDELSEMATDAIERNLQIIGEAANHLPAIVTDQYPEIPWTQIRGFRNILVHQYFGVDFEVVREVVDVHLIALASALKTYLELNQIADSR